MIPAVKIESHPFEDSRLSIVKVLVYFDLFNYPLTASEIRDFLQCDMTTTQFDSALRQLTAEEVITKFDDFYSLARNPAQIQNRLQGNARARELLPKAARIGAFLYKFPFVRGVGVSGSLSKNYADAKADIDFFVITKANRLWVARTVLHMFKKLTFLVGRQHFYCMNYFVDEQALLISEQNIYSATEVVTLLPSAGTQSIESFLAANKWTEEWLPCYQRETGLPISDRGSAFKRFFESVLAGKIGDRFDEWLLHWTTLRWKKKEQFGRKNQKGRIMSLVTDKHFSKSDPGAFQQKIVNLYEARVEQFRDRYPQFSY